MSRRLTSHWSIGEVLSLLRDEFPEVTISKIRFLESQGLISPERTPSGYRRFYEQDFDRLRWILVQQRDHYLPLKVIRGRLEQRDATGLDSGDDLEVLPGPALAEVVDLTEVRIEAGHPEPLEANPRVTEASFSQPQPQPQPQPQLEVEVAAVDRNEPSIDDVFDQVAAELAAELPSVQPSDVADPDLQRPQPPASEPSAPQHRTANLADQALEPVALSLDELVEASGCEQSMVQDLERFKLIEGRTMGSQVLFDEHALAVACLARRFGQLGLEPRHLRTFKLGVEREFGLLAQIVEPMMHRRSPEAREESVRTLHELTDMASDLRAVLVHQAVQEQLPRS